MYDKRIRIFVLLIACLLIVCLLRLGDMQLLSGSFYRNRVAKLKQGEGLSRQLKTIRGRILGRNGEVLADDEPQFWLHINYNITCFMDERVCDGRILEAAAKYNSQSTTAEVKEQLEAGLEDLRRVIDKCARFRGVSTSQMEAKVRKINDFIWNRRAFQAWRKAFPNSDILQNYDSIISVPISVAIADFQRNQPGLAERLKLINKVDIAEMHKSWPLLELRTDDDIFMAQLEFLDIEGVEILPRVHRVYPFGRVAAQTIGWVGPPQENDRKLFEEDKLSYYLEDEVCGREDGVEYVCEAALRGRRGEEVFDIDRRLISRTQTQFGTDVSLTLDVELQQRIEEYIADCRLNTNCSAPSAAVVIDVATGDILALVSTPVFDLNCVRYDYGDILADLNEPLRNRAINKQYPPGSVVKPLVLVAGLESGSITVDEVISCPAAAAPKGWPNCWIYNRHRSGHDYQWLNNARNAIKGSCNIYFSRLADRIEPAVLQQWLFRFGYGHKISLTSNLDQELRELRQVQGQISSVRPESEIEDFNEVFVLVRDERRYFGMGQGNLRATPLQVANAMACLARGGLYKPPRLSTHSIIASEVKQSHIDNLKIEIRNSEGINLNISPQTLSVIHDGMWAVVNEPGGTAYKEFTNSGIPEQGVTVYGKTGSTEEPDNAWFAGFAKDNNDRNIAVSVVVEGGQHGSQDAAPLARDIIQFCIEAEYIGNSGLQSE